MQSCGTSGATSPFVVQDNLGWLQSRPNIRIRILYQYAERADRRRGRHLGIIFEGDASGAEAPHLLGCCDYVRLLADQARRLVNIICDSMYMLSIGDQRLEVWATLQMSKDICGCNKHMLAIAAFVESVSKGQSIEQDNYMVVCLRFFPEFA